MTKDQRPITSHFLIKYLISKYIFFKKALSNNAFSDITKVIFHGLMSGEKFAFDKSIIKSIFSLLKFLDMKNLTSLCMGIMLLTSACSCGDPDHKGPTPIEQLIKPENAKALAKVLNIPYG